MTPDTSDALQVLQALAARPHPPALARAERSTAIPAERGLYAWWRRSPDDLPAVPAAEPLDLDAAVWAGELLYIGISPSTGTGGGRLRSRLRQHLQGPVGASTVRRTLAAVLWEELGLRPSWAGDRPCLSPGDTARLSAWQDEHLRVSWVVHAEPWAIEGAVIKQFAPPLNLDGNVRHSFHSTLTELRARFQAAARAAGEQPGGGDRGLSANAARSSDAAPSAGDDAERSEHAAADTNTGPERDLPHLFITQGDLTHLACDAFLVPSGTSGGRRWHVETPAWIAALNGRRAGTVDGRGFVMDAAPAGHGRAWEIHPRAVAAGVAEPAIWVGHTGDTARDPAWYADGVAEFVRGAARQLVDVFRAEADLREQRQRARKAGESTEELAPEPPARPAGSDRPLLGIPLVGTGAGGAADRKDDTIEAILRAVREAQRDLRAGEMAPDVVLVLHDRADFAAAQQARRDLWPDGAFAALDSGQREAAERLAKEARAGQLVPFVGAGAGIGAGLPSWSELLQRLADRAGIPTSDQRALSKLDARDQADVLARMLQDGELKAAVVEFTGGEDRRVSLTHQLLASMPVHEVVTTNYDECLETAFRDARRPLRRIGDTRAEDESDGWLLKMHGGVHEPGSIILSRTDYLRFEGEGVALAGVVQAMLLTRHLVFVGYSLSDDNFHRLVHQAAQVGAGAAGAVRRPGRSMRATALTPEAAGLAERVWGDRVEFVSTASSGAMDARCLAILLDAVAADTAPPTEHLLDPSYAGLFREDDRTIGRRLADLWAAVEEASSAEGCGPSLVADAVREALERIGPRPKGEPASVRRTVPGG